MSKSFTCIKSIPIIFLFTCLLCSDLRAQQMALPAHASLYTGIYVRGYWFTAPTSFTITGLMVAPEAGTGQQFIHAMKCNTPFPIAFTAQSTNFNTLAYISFAPNNVMQTVNVPVTNGDVIGIMGTVTGICNSYAAAAVQTSSIGANPVTLTRFGHQGSVETAPAPSYWGEAVNSTGQIGRVFMWYSVGPICDTPANPTVTGITSTSANFSWGAVTGATGYQYALNTSAAPPGTGTGIPGTTYPGTGLTPGTTYYFHVRTVCGPSSFSNWKTITFTTPASCVAPSAPVISSISQTGATATWGAVPASTGYQWAVTTSATPPASGAGTPATSQPLTALTPGTTYYFHVRNLCSSSLISTWSTTSFTTLYPPCDPPGTPAVSNINVNGATITWTPPATTSTGYQWAVTTSPTPPASGTPTTNTSENASGLNGGTLYYVHVRNNCGPGGFSSWVTTTFTTSSSCTQPSNIIITNVGTISADVQWDPVPGAVGFEYIVDNTPQTPTTAGAAIAYNQYSPHNLVSATRYYLHLRTNCGVGGGYSAWVTVQFTTDTVCFAPVAVIDNITGTKADLSWQAEPNAVNYQYLVTTNITPPFSGYATTSTRHVAKGLTKNTQYYMHLRAYCGGNDISSWRSTGFVTNEQTTGVQLAGQGGFEMVVYPNPVNDHIILELKGATAINGQAILTDVTGKIIQVVTITQERTNIRMDGVAQGVYMLKYSDGERNGTIKIVKQ